MRKTDYLLRGMAFKNQYRFFVVDSTGVVQTALDLHKLAPAPTLLLGRLLTAALLMGAELKNDSTGLSINIEADGPLKGAIAIYEPEGNVRGYAKQPDYFAPETKENWQIGKLLGSGNLSVIKDLRLKAPETGTIKLVSGEIGEDIAHYYLQSEQVPTAVSLGVLFDAEGKIRSAGGYLIQQLPEAKPQDLETLAANLANTPYITDLLDMGLGWEDILKRMIFKDMDWTISQTMEVRYRCSCTRERFANALRLLGQEELETLTAGISTICHYCNKQYDFSAEDIRQIIESIKV